jgi:hypothetical protein
MLYDQRHDLTEFPERVAIWALVVVLVIPVVGGISVGWVQDRLDVRRLRGDELSWIERTVATLQSPSAWDWLFTGAPPFGKYLVIAFDDGTRVAGVYASGSVAITSPQAHGLFLCPEWVMDDSYELIQELPGSAGITVSDLTKVRWVRIIEGVTDAD